jgi:hypothetical protein
MYRRGVDALNHHHLFHFWTVGVAPSDHRSLPMGRVETID